MARRVDGEVVGVLPVLSAGFCLWRSSRVSRRKGLLHKGFPRPRACTRAKQARYCMVRYGTMVVYGNIEGTIVLECPMSIGIRMIILPSKKLLKALRELSPEWRWDSK